MSESWNKKERERKKQQSKKEKEEKKQQRKEKLKESGIDDMIAFVDENGNISSTPPDPSKRVEIRAEDIDLSVSAGRNELDEPRTGQLMQFNESKGYGFIRDLQSGQSIFVHITNMEEELKERDRVSFELGRGPKGPVAMQVKLLR